MNMSHNGFVSAAKHARVQHQNQGVKFATTPVTHIVPQEQLDWHGGEHAEVPSAYLQANGEALAKRSYAEAKLLEERDAATAPAPAATMAPAGGHHAPANMPRSILKAANPVTKSAPVRRGAPTVRSGQFAKPCSPVGSRRHPEPLSRAITDNPVKQAPAFSSTANNVAHKVGQAAHHFGEAVQHAFDASRNLSTQRQPSLVVPSSHSITLEIEPVQKLRRAATTFDDILDGNQTTTWQEDDNTRWQKSLRGKGFTGLSKAKDHLRKVKQDFAGSYLGSGRPAPSGDWAV
ncbi:hypothetical protein NX059_008199 [Plenodomus lindquistii]|nr:hypothetical protein NX059_008199 [Plenodomus lindquistii]